MKILLAEDDSAVRQSLYSFLLELGHSITEVSDGREALNTLKMEQYDLLLSDIRMPEIDGLELLKMIKNTKKLEAVQVILFTGHGGVKSAIEAMRSGAYDYLLKPIDIKELTIVLERLEEYIGLKKENTVLNENMEQEVDKRTETIKQELSELRRAYAQEVGTVEIGVCSPKLKKIFETGAKYHNNPDVNILIEGETGTGKEVIARYIHFGDELKTSPFVALNCASISPTLFESELFGYEPGAFSGGNPKGQAGKIEIADGGSIFLDEIGEMAIDFQAKLLRVIQEREYYRVGGVKKQKANVRFICATNQDIKARVADGTFREDLYFRLNIGHIVIPPLRERTEEIVPLARLFLAQISEKKNTRFKSISDSACQRLLDYSWPGNVRELKNTIERIVILNDDTVIKPKHLEVLFTENLKVYNSRNNSNNMNDNNDNDIDPIVDIDNIELPDNGIELHGHTLDIVKKALEKHQYNKTKTAKFLGLTRNELYTYLKKIET